MDYIHSRNQQTENLKEYKREEINMDRKTPGILVSDMWERKRTIKRTLFAASGNNKGQEIQVQYIDIA